MIPLQVIRSVLTSLLKKNFTGYEVHFSTNFCAKADYFYVELTEEQRALDKVYRERNIGVELHFVPMPDARGRVNRRDKLFTTQEKLAELFLDVIQIGDRFVTVLNASSRIVDEVLIFTFRLQFADYIEQEPVELMKELYIDSKAQPMLSADTEIYFSDTKGE